MTDEIFRLSLAAAWCFFIHKWREQAIEEIAATGTKADQHLYHAVLFIVWWLGIYGIWVSGQAT